MMLLEPRIMFDASIAATVDAVSVSGPADAVAPVATSADMAPHTADAPVNAQPMPADLMQPNVEVVGLDSHAAPPAQGRTEIVVIDQGVTGWQALRDSVGEDYEVILVDASQDGLTQILDQLEGRSGIDAIHFLSHGAEGQVTLGTLTLDSSTAQARSADLASLGEKLAADGDLLLYGCKVADSNSTSFVALMGSLTGAEVAASTDDTGAQRLGGDWILEHRTGSVESDELWLGATAPAFDNVLATVTLNSSWLSSNVDDWSTSDNQAGGNLDATGSSIYLSVNSSAFNTPPVEFTISSVSATPFNLNSLTVSPLDNNDYRLEIYPTGNYGAKVTGQLIASDAGNNIVITTNLNNITSFTIRFLDVVPGPDGNEGSPNNLDFLSFVTSPANTAPAIANLNTDSVAWAGIGASVTLDSGGNASLTDTELGALNTGNGNWNGASLTVQRSTAIAADNFGFNTSGALFTVSGTSASGNLQSSGLTFATYTNTGGVLTTSFTNSGITPTTALVNDVARHISYQNNTPAGDATIRFTLHDGTVAGTVANVTVTSDSIFVTNTTDTASIDITNGVSFSEAIGIAAADVTGSQTIAIAGSLASTALTVNSVTLGESLTFDMDAASGMSLTTGTITLGGGTLSLSNGTGDTATISSVLAGSGALTKIGAGTVTLSGTNTYSGTTTVSAGTLTVSGGDAIASVSSVAVASGATLALSSNESVGNLSGAGSITLGSNTLSTTQTANTTFSGGISGGGGLSINQASANTFALTLSGTNAYTGATTLQNYGWLRLSGDASLSSSTELRFNGNSRATMLSDQTVGSIFSNSATANLDLGSFTLSAGGNNSSTSAAGAISGTGNVIKQGSGTLTLSGTNTYSGTTTVSAGALSVSSDSNLGSDAVTLASGATFDVSGATNIDNAITLAGDATISNSANATLSGIIGGSNTLTKSGASTLTLSNNTNSYSATTVSAGTLSVASDSNLGSGTVTLAGGTTLAITGATNIDNLFALTGNAAISTTANATVSGVISGSSNLSKTGAARLTLSAINTYGGATTVSAGTLSIASDSNLGSGGLTLAAGTTLALTGATNIDNAVTLSGAATVNTTADAILSGNIGGAGSLAKTGANALTLSGTNSYAGTTTISAGTLSVGSDGNLGSSTITLATGTTLAVTGATTIDNAVALSGNATVQAANAVTLSGAISGGGGLNKTGAGTVTLSGSNGFTGNVAVSAGGLTLSGGAAIDNNSALTMSASTTLTLSASETIGSLAGGGSVALGANTLTMGGDNSSTTFGGNISGTGGGITKTGNGTLSLSGNNSSTGSFTISAGAVDVQSGDAMGDTSAVSIASGAFLVLTEAETIGSLAGAGSVSLGNPLTTGGNNASTTFSGDLNGGSELVKAGSGTLTLSNPGNSGSMSGDITVAAGTLSVASDNNLSSGTITLAGGSTLDVTGATNIDNAVTLTGNATVNNSANATLSGTLSGANSLTKTGASTLTLSGTNTHAGTTVSAGTLSVASDGNLGSSSLFLANGTTLAVTGATTIDNALSVSGNVMVTNSAAVTLSGAISGNGNLSKSGASALTLSGTNAAHAGNITVNAGTLSIGADSNLGSGIVTLAGGTTLRVTSGGTIDNNLTLAGAATLQVAAATTWSGVISGSNNLAKTGASTLTLSNTNTLAGTITVSAGTLAVTGTASATTVASAATLTGTGTIDGTVSVQSGGTLSPGESPGTLTVNGDLAMDAGSTLVVEINGATAGTDYDQIIVNGTVDVSGATLSVTHGYVAGSGDVYNIIVNDAADAVTGTFSGLSEGATVNAGGNSTVLTASYIGTTGNDVTLTAPVNPVVTSVSSSTPNGTYKVGDTISVSVTFDMAVFVSGGTPTLLLETGTVDRALNYVSGSGSTTLVFDYTVQAGDLSADLDYASTGALVLNGGTLQDALNNNANLTLAIPGAADSLGANKSLVVDGVLPAASIVVADTALAVGETSTVTITFSEAVTGFTNADLTISNGTLGAVSSADGGITWTATFTPTASVADATNLITLNNIGIQDAAGNTGAGTTDSNNYAIDTSIIDTGIPAVTSVSVPGNGTYVAGQNLDFTVTLSEAVMVDSTGGEPRIAVTLDNGGTVYASYLSGSGSTELLFRLTVADGQLDANGVTLGGAIDTNGASVRDAAGNDASVQLNNVGSSANVLVDASAPTASGLVLVDAPSANGTLNYTLTFSEDVDGVDVNDLSLVTTGYVTVDISSVTQVDARTYDIALSNVAGNGTLRVDLNSSGTGIVDTAGNAIAGGLVGPPHALTAIAPTLPVARSDNLPLALPFSSVVTAPLSPSLPSIFDLQDDSAPGYALSSLVAPSIFNVAVGVNQRFNIPLPWRPERFTHWTVVELRSSNGAEVPTWLHYDFTTGTLQGTPPADFHGTLQIDLVETDSHGQRVIGTMRLHFDDVSQRSDADNAVKPPAKRAATKAGLDAQFASHARNAPLDADAASLLRQLHFRTSDRPPAQNHAHF